VADAVGVEVGVWRKVSGEGDGDLEVVVREGVLLVWRTSPFPSEFWAHLYQSAFKARALRCWSSEAAHCGAFDGRKRQSSGHCQISRTNDHHNHYSDGQNPSLISTEGGKSIQQEVKMFSKMASRERKDRAGTLGQGVAIDGYCFYPLLTLSSS
jgi:hypothetical protein